jgi:hypothetical protein
MVLGAHIRARGVTDVATLALIISMALASDAQPGRVVLGPDASIISAPAVVIYEHANYAGQARMLGVGSHLLADFNDVASSIKVPSGMAAIIYEHAAGTSGYGISVDLLEDQPDLTAYNLNDQASFVTVFLTTKTIGNTTYVYARNQIVDGQFVAGHWERQSARPRPPNTVAVVAPPLPNPVLSTAGSVLSVDGPTTTITSLGPQTEEGRELWERAINDQMGIIGNDYRGPEEIGTACFERASNNVAIPDNFNFWCPQKQLRDHRRAPYFKRTEVGRVKEVRQAKIDGTFADYDVNIDVAPNTHYMYLVNDAHPREYTDLMAAQWKATGAIPYLEQSGLPNCNSRETIKEFHNIEAEVAEDYWPKGNHTFGRARFADLALMRVGRDISLYGTWIYDRGHCCHPEIHPAEQVWWSEAQTNGRQYNLNVFCDASRRFFWRKQMDEGTKGKPWAEPPIKGLFAIAFEYSLPIVAQAVISTTKQFEAGYIQHYNLVAYPGAEQTYKLVYRDRTLVSFIPHNEAFKVSFEHVGTVPGEPNHIRGFMVIETSVGKLTQIATSITVIKGAGTETQVLRLPANASPDQAPQLYEDRFFRKEEGHYLFTITETTVTHEPVVRQ